MGKKHIVYLDYLRLAATVSVIILHAASQKWYYLDPAGFTWNIFNLYNSAVRWGVPIFIMISGSLFLSRDIPLGTLYTKNILHMVTAFCFWSAFYAVAMAWIDILKDPSNGIWLKKILLDMISGWYHLWFLPMIAGMYMCVPLLRQIVKNKETGTYYLVLSAILSLAIPQAVTMIHDFVGGLPVEIVDAANKVVANMHIHTVLGYGFYFVLGWYLSTHELAKKQRTRIYILGIIGFLTTVMLTWIVNKKLQRSSEFYYEYLTVNVALEAAAIFVWAKYSALPNEKWNMLVSTLSKYSFGAYLVHIFVLDLLNVIGFHTLTFHPVIAVPIISLVVLILSFGISFTIHRIPILKKWIV